MKFDSKTSKTLPNSDALIVPIVEGQKTLKGWAKELDQLFSGQISQVIKSEVNTGKKGQSTTLYGGKGTSIKTCVLLGLGDKKTITPDDIRNAAGTLARSIKVTKVGSLGWLLDEATTTISSKSELGQLLSEGMGMGAYTFDRYLSKATKPTLKTVTLWTSNTADQKALSEGCRVGTIVDDSVNTARDLTNTPANDLMPRHFVDHVKKLGAKSKLIKIEIIDEAKAKKMGMHAFLGVGLGSVEKSYMAVIRYNGGKKGEKPVALVGKGITFDTGGVSIKPSKGMGEMKGDMGGAAAVFGAMEGLIKLKPKKNIIAVMPFAENMCSGTAQRPGDVVTAMNGTTIEITNTDAEGRLVLADALCYTAKQNPSHILDAATLTGAVVIALGDKASGIMGNDDKLIAKLKALEPKTGERLWQLPLYDDYLDYMKSDVADILNASEGRMGGTITAAKFLEQFVSDIPWVHFDIAATGRMGSTSGYTLKGMSGSGVRTFIAHVLSEAN